MTNRSELEALINRTRMAGGSVLVGYDAEGRIDNLTVAMRTPTPYYVAPYIMSPLEFAETMRAKLAAIGA